MPVDQRTQDYLIRAHNRVIAHYHHVLASDSLPGPERKRLQQSLAGIEAELEAFKRGENLHFAEAG